MFENTIETYLKALNYKASDSKTHLHLELKSWIRDSNFISLHQSQEAAILSNHTLQGNSSSHPQRRGQTKHNFKLMSFDNELTNFNPFLGGVGMKFE